MTTVPPGPRPISDPLPRNGGLCDEDGRPFVSGAYQARSCSDRCRNRALKRAVRERHRDDIDIQHTSA